MTDTQDERQTITVADARAAVLASGELEGLEGPLYLGDAEGATWLPYFSKALYGRDGHPEFAKVIITRRGQTPREVVISWDEYAEIIGEDDAANEREAEWNDTRKRKPMSIFGAEAERHAYRVVFADVLAQIAPSRPYTEQYLAAAEPQAAPERDWHADLAKTSTKPEVDALFEEARAAKALTDAGLHEAFTRRLREVLASPKPPADEWEPKPTPAPTLGAVPSPAVVAAKSKPLTVNPPRRPQGDRPQGQRRRSKSR